jgi:hypothetical protein
MMQAVVLDRTHRATACLAAAGGEGHAAARRLPTNLVAADADIRLENADA